MLLELVVALISPPEAPLFCACGVPQILLGFRVLTLPAQRGGRKLRETLVFQLESVI